MPVRTTKVDLSATIRSQPLSPFRGGGGSFGLGLASGVTGFDFQVINPLVDGEEFTGFVALVKVDQEGALYSLINDANGRFAFEVDGETGEAVLDEGGYARLIADEAFADIADVEYQIVIRVSWGGGYTDFTRAVPIDPADPLDYSLTTTDQSFNIDVVDGGYVTDVVAVDNRAQIDSVVLTDDAGGRFSVVNRNNVVRTETAVTDDTTYTLVATVTFMDGHVETGFTFDLTTVSLG